MARVIAANRRKLTCLRQRGPYTLRGYCNAPEHNQRAFSADGFYRSGDLMWRHQSGNHVVAGRTKDLINRGGERISAEEVENEPQGGDPTALNAHWLGGTASSTSRN